MRHALCLLGVLLAGPALAEQMLTVAARDITDRKAVFATVESRNTVPARTRIGGTVVALGIRQGDEVTAGASLATIGDAKLALRIAALDAQIAGLNSQAAQAQNDVTRAETLFRQGAGTRLAYDQGRTALEVAQSAIKARSAERDVLRQSLVEGEVLAPVAGRVLDVPLTEGSVVLSGDVVATIAERRFILRLRIPERHAGTIKAGDKVVLDAAKSGVVTLVYPRIEEGRVVADAEVAGLGEYFVGTRLLVWIDAGTRRGVVVPASFIFSRFGIDLVRLRQGTAVVEVPVQRGQPSEAGVEILSGVADGDVLVSP